MVNAEKILGTKRFQECENESSDYIFGCMHEAEFHGDEERANAYYEIVNKRTEEMYREIILEGGRLHGDSV